MAIIDGRVMPSDIASGIDIGIGGLPKGIYANAGFTRRRVADGEVGGFGEFCVGDDADANDNDVGGIRLSVG